MVDRLSASLAPGSRREIGAIVSELLVHYHADSVSDAVEDARNKAWIEALEDLPPWAVDEARRRWNRAEVPGVNPDFAPKPPRFRQIVEEVLRPARARRDKLALLLKAEPEKAPENLTDEQREAVLARIRTNLDAIRKASDPSKYDRERRAAERQHRQDEAADMRIPVPSGPAPSLSPEALARFSSEAREERV